MSRYLRPTQMDEALAALSDRPWTPLAGGTDFYPARVGREVNDDILDLSGIAALRGLQEEASHWRLGAMTTWADIVRAPLPPWLAALQWAAREIGAVQIQNAGTVGGNLCNASPAADGVPVLLALDASVELRSATSRREMPLSQFITGPRSTQRTAHELLTAIHIPKPAGEARSLFLKLGGRRYLVISIVMVAVCLETDAQDRIRRAGVAVGACSGVAQRLSALEQALIGQIRGQAAAEVKAAHFDGLGPIDDVRGRADFRLASAIELVREALREVTA